MEPPQNPGGIKDLPYAYAGCNPVNNTDPSGTCTVWEALAGLFGVEFAGGIALESAEAFAIGGIAAPLAGIFIGIVGIAGALYFLAYLENDCVSPI
jgi:hypothetical protein